MLNDALLLTEVVNASFICVLCITEDMTGCGLIHNHQRQMTWYKFFTFVYGPAVLLVNRGKCNQLLEIPSCIFLVSKQINKQIKFSSCFRRARGVYYLLARSLFKMSLRSVRSL